MLVLYVLLVLSPKFSEAICCANDFDQAQARTFKQIARIVEASPLLAGDALILRDRIEFAGTKSTILAIASDAAGSAGSNAAIVVFDELWGFVSEKSRRLWDEAVPPPTRRIACRLTVSYAGYLDESQLLLSLYQRGMAGKLIGEELYATDDGLLCAWHTKPVAPWQDKSWLDSMRATCRPAAFLRLACNQWVASESSFLEEEWIAACTDPAHRPMSADLKLPIWLGLDASTRKDSTAIVACTWDRAAKRVVLVGHRIFVPTKDSPIDFELVEETVINLRRQYDVVCCLFDPYQFASSAQRLTRAGVFMREFPQTIDRLTAASQNLFDLFKSGGIVIYDDPDIKLALQRSVAKEGSRGWKITKSVASHRIDVVVALAQAALAAVQAGEEPESAGIIVTVGVMDAPVRDRWSASNYYDGGMSIYGSGGGGSVDSDAGFVAWTPKNGGW
jgi:hypothetical protein